MRRTVEGESFKRFALAGSKRGTDAKGYYEDKDEDERQERELSCAYSEETIRNYRFFLDEDITAPSKYRQLIHVLLSAAPTDRIELIINSGGGRLDSAVAIISAIFNSQATVVGFVMGDCYSAASMIALACHELYVEDFGTFMVHSASYGTGGSHREISDRASFEEGRLNTIYNLIYTGFLTEEEIEKVRCGYTYWMQTEEVRERLDKRKEYFATRQDEDIEEEEKVILLS